jgi:glyceraldehyde-3-phosphate dehydrogenase/erythrose-4-phosphate dehydrogenase
MLTRKYISDVSVNASSKNRLKSILHDSLIIWQGWADKIHVVTSDACIIEASPDEERRQSRCAPPPSNHAIL